MEFTDALRPMLNRYGTHPNFQLVIFTFDETVFSREIGPLAGFYPSVFAGVPGGSSTPRRRSAATGRPSPSRPDSPRPPASSTTPGPSARSRPGTTCPAGLDAGFVAQLVAEHRLGEDEAFEVMHDLVATNPRKAFKL